MEEDSEDLEEGRLEEAGEDFKMVYKYGPKQKKYKKLYYIKNKERISKLNKLRYKTVGIKIKCKQCKKYFIDHPNKLNYKYGRFCSRKCYFDFRRGKSYKELYDSNTSKNMILKLKSRINEFNPNWKGNKVSYGALHDYIKSKINKPSKCESCNIRPAFDITNISGKYKRDLKDWKWLCRRCHMIDDGRLEKFIKVNNK